MPEVEWPKSSTSYFTGVQDRVKALVASRQLSLFSSGDWGHPAYQLPPEANLLAVAHYIEALDRQRGFIRIHTVLGGKNPHLQTCLVGGMATAIDSTEPEAVINPERATLFNELVSRADLRQPGLGAGCAGHRRLMQAAIRPGPRQLPGLRRAASTARRASSRAA
ncbi:MAG: nickel-dependent hydrogenase large subunit [Acidobacteriaceae bacterium]|jgi:Ni,Fe-hydrogenase I large subunit